MTKVIFQTCNMLKPLVKLRNCQVQLMRDHHILVLSSAYNGLTQRIHTNLVEQNHDVKFRLSLSPENISKTVRDIQPDFVICPFLKEKIPTETWKEYLCVVFHPGIPGDGGAHSLDWAILNQEPTWGGTLLAANDELDGGDIWATGTFPLPQDMSKADIYRGPMTQVAADCIDSFLMKYDISKNVEAELGETVSNVVKAPSDFETTGKWRDPAAQKIRKIHWESDTTCQIMRKINSSDSAPGVLDTFFGEQVFLYGVHAEGNYKASPKEIICTRNGAICVGTIDGAVWITHMRQKKESKFPFKLPAGTILERQLKRNKIPEIPYLPMHRSNIEYLSSDGTPKNAPNTAQTYRDIFYQEYQDIGILNFQFYNGAMCKDQCRRLMKAYERAKKCPTKVLVLNGKGPFFSNGINLNKIESLGENASKESWDNINAINKIVGEILSCEDKITVSAVEGSAGAGGVFLAAASDEVWVSEKTMLNPHYATMGLTGSEYHTYTLPKRVGHGKGQQLLKKCLPVNSMAALRLGLVDKIIPMENFQQDVITEASKLSANHSTLIKKKRKNRIKEKHEVAVIAANSAELHSMYSDFQNEVFHQARKKFVMKTPATETPMHLVHNCPGDIFKPVQGTCKLLDGKARAEEITDSLKKIVDDTKEKYPLFQPRLEIIQVGGNQDSNLYIKQKLLAAQKIGIQANLRVFPSSATEEEVFEELHKFNKDDEVHGIMMQLPLDSQVIKSPAKLIDAINPEKDVDALVSTNLGKIFAGDTSGLMTCTPAACMDLIKMAGCKVQGSKAVVVGRSSVVGSPVASLLKWENATVVNCHEHTKNLQKEVEGADIVVVAVGLPGVVQGSWIKEGAVVIDCGINPVTDFTKKSGYGLVGDVDWSLDNLKASFITPVPGGVGPITVSMLMANTIKAALTVFGFMDAQKNDIVY